MGKIYQMTPKYTTNSTKDYDPRPSKTYQNCNFGSGNPADKSFQMSNRRGSRKNETSPNWNFRWNENYLHSC
jgi:hypothetical protein